MSKLTRTIQIPVFDLPPRDREEGDLIVFNGLIRCWSGERWIPAGPYFHDEPTPEVHVSRMPCGCPLDSGGAGWHTS